MPDLSTLIIFSCAVLGLLLVPGSNMVFLINHAISHGWRGGVAVAIGICIADLLLTVLTALGVSAILATSVVLFEFLRYVGISYLLWLAWQSWRQTGALRLGVAANKGIRQLMARGLLNSMFNPKALLFFSCFCLNLWCLSKAR